MPVLDRRSQLDKYDRLFIITAFAFQILLIVFFFIRKNSPETAIRYGWIVYALSLAALVISALIFRGGMPIWFWLGGVLYGIWAAFGFSVEYLLGLGGWRDPINWIILIPYVLLYLATIMFYWWPVGMLSRPLWYVYAGLFALSTWLNISSH
jgi:hypothetical protein